MPACDSAHMRGACASGPSPDMHVRRRSPARVCGRGLVTGSVGGGARGRPRHLTAPCRGTGCKRGVGSGSAQRQASSRLQRLILRPVVVGVKEAFEPLQELKVVLELAFHQLVYGDDLQ